MAVERETLSLCIVKIAKVPNEERYIKQFRREAEALKDLSDRTPRLNIPLHYDYDCGSYPPFLIEEFIVGESLSNRKSILNNNFNVILLQRK